MTKDEVIKRIQELTLQKTQQEQIFEQAKANANAISGAIQELTAWYNKVETTPETSECEVVQDTCDVEDKAA